MGIPTGLNHIGTITVSAKTKAITDEGVLVKINDERIPPWRRRMWLPANAFAPEVWTAMQVPDEQQAKSGESNERRSIVVSLTIIARVESVEFTDTQ